jgi:hypothetical protein
MSLEKTEARAAGIHEVGMRMDDLLESAQQEVHRCEGAALGLLQASKPIQELAGHVEDDIKAGKLDGLETLQVAEVIKRYIARSAQIIENLSHKARNQQLAAMGQVQGMQTAVAITKKMFDAEQAKGAAIAAVEATPEGQDTDLRHRPEGVRPPMSIKAQRLAEEAAVSVSEQGGTVTQLPVRPTNGKGKRRRKV